MRIAAQDDNHDERIQPKKNFVFKGSFDQERADQIMIISSVKTAAQFDQLEGKASREFFVE